MYEPVSSTIGVEFAYKVAFLKNKTKVKAQIWDTCKFVSFLTFLLAGSEKYRSITTGHYRFALGAVIMYDVCNRESFKNCLYWLQNVRSYADENVVVALVGNFILNIFTFR